MTVIWLDDPAAVNKDLCGGKASTLARLKTQGFQVPDGFVIPTDLFHHFLGDIGLRSELDSLQVDHFDDSKLLDRAGKIRQRILDAPLPKDISQAVEEALRDYEQRCGRPQLWAVRSSAVAEDLQTASFAGQYETLLGLANAGEVTAGILRCWASIFGDRAIRYGREQDNQEIRAAILIQQLIQADVSGVCFTVDPVSGSERRIIINANYGLGQSVVGGTVTPDTFEVDRQSLTVISRQIAQKTQKIVPTDADPTAPDPVLKKVKSVPVSESLSSLPCLTDELAVSISQLALQVEAQAVHPVDIEWAFCDGQLYLLQSRPVTTLGEALESQGLLEPAPPPEWAPECNTPIDPRFPLYSNGNIGEVLPGCVTPLTWDHTGRIIERAFRLQLIELGAVQDGGPPWQVMGFFYHRPYICVSFLAGAAMQIPIMTPDTIIEEFVGPTETKTPPFTKSDLLPGRWPVWFSVLGTVIKKLLFMKKQIQVCTRVIMDEARRYSPEALADWSDDRLLAAVRHSDDLAYPSLIHTWTSTFAVVSFSLLRDLTKAWCDDADSSLAAQLVTGISDVASAAPTSAIYELATAVKDTPELMTLFRSPRSSQELYAALLTNEDKGALAFRERLETFLARYGHRAVGEAEFSIPNWREDPAQVLALIRNYLQAGTTSPDTIRQRQQAIYQASWSKIERLNPIKRLVLKAVTGRTRQFITYREHLKDLSILRADRSRRVYGEIKKRLLDRRLLRRPEDLYFLLWLDIQALMTDQITAEETAALIVNRRCDYDTCLQLSVPKLQDGKARFLTVADHPAESKWKGIAVSPGQVEGLARVVLDPRSKPHIEPGEILVAPVTDVAWTPLFLNAAGLVVEVGGLLSHGSVVAREYGLPAVVGVAGATQAIKTGDRLLLDGNAGLVVKLN